MIDLVFFYGTLMGAFRRPRSLAVDPRLTLRGRGSIPAALFDLGQYPGAIPATDSRVLGELHQMSDADAVLVALDEFEGYRPGRPDDGLFIRSEVMVTLEDGRTAQAWVYFYNRSIDRAVRVESGDYLQHLVTRQA